MLQRKAHENYQNLPEEEKNKKRVYASNGYRKIFIENQFSEEENNEKHQYERNLHNKLSKVKKTKGVNIRVKNKEPFSKKKKDKQHQYAREQHRNLPKKL